MSDSWKDRRVVITGLGVVNSLGFTADSFWQKLIAGECGIGMVTQFDASDYSCRIAAEVRDFDPSPAFPSPKDIRRTDRFVQFGVYAGYQALLDSGMDLESLDRDRIGTYIGSGIGGLFTTEEQHKILLNRGPKRVSPFMIPMLILNMASGIFSIHYKLRGPNLAICSACATSSHSIGEAWRTIKMGDADAIFAGGAEASIVPLGMSGFSAMRAMSTRNDDPKKSSRPFEKDRDGFVMGEGAGVVIVEELDHAIRRGAKIYCELVGYGNTADASHLTSPAPEGEGAARCMRQVNYVNAHGTATFQGDICETQAIKTVFGESSAHLAVSSTKGATGHMLGAAGAVEMAVCAKAIETGIVPPTINLDTPDPACDLDYVPNEKRSMNVQVTMSNSFGFGGHNATLLASKYQA
ncbi:MAG TPA: beta-ketoacyl-[acyl-carrier-protein] synthase II [Verrucomicrobiales bacterium]|nr:beta-ketoacyl-[acyl-carrier-protein] synthase II [Verrucomicrobiales bacterium]